ncbi:MAG: aldo/keto reductase [Planctomycetaceae bacterium]|nr:aldo/keto reductase [Planctomycetaceae bacterium]
MQYRRFGRTELQMPLITCGGMRFQFQWQDLPLSDVPADNQNNMAACVQRAFELGINHFETARGYGSSERQLGLILPKLPRDAIIVQTKIAPEDDPAVFVANFEESLRRLNLDCVDLLALHGINDEQVLHQAVRPGGCLAAARKIQAAGKAKHIGFSTHGPADVIVAAIEHEGDGGFDYVNLHWFYIQQWNWPAIEAATRRDMGVFVISPVDKGGKLYEPPQRLVDLCQPLHPIVFNDLFCLSHRQVHTLSIGVSRPSDFDHHAQAVDQLERAPALLAPIVARLEQAYEAAVQPALRNPMAMGLPTWKDTPGEINIPSIVWLRNLAAAYDMIEYGKMRYNLLGSGGHWFPGNRADKMDDLDLRGALGKHPAAEAVLAAVREAHALLKGEEVKRLQTE